VIALLGDVHRDLVLMRAKVGALPPQITSVIQVGDMWVWPNQHAMPTAADGSIRVLPSPPSNPEEWWERPDRPMLMIDGNHHLFPLTRGLTNATEVAPGLTFQPRGSVRVLDGRTGPLRVGFLGGGDSRIDLEARKHGADWWPDEEAVTEADVDRLLANAVALGGLDLLVTHVPPACVARAMTSSVIGNPSSELVEIAWRQLGGGTSGAALQLVCGHMHRAWRDDALRVEVLPELGITYR
jgi:hypothetical protein